MAKLTEHDTQISTNFTATKSHMNLTKSKQRIADHGEVFTPAWMVEAMLDLVARKAS